MNRRFAPLAQRLLAIGWLFGLCQQTIDVVELFLCRIAAACLFIFTSPVCELPRRPAQEVLDPQGVPHNNIVHGLCKASAQPGKGAVPIKSPTSLLGSCSRAATLGGTLVGCLGPVLLGWSLLGVPYCSLCVLDGRGHLQSPCVLKHYKPDPLASSGCYLLCPHPFSQFAAMPQLFGAGSLLQQAHRSLSLSCLLACEAFGLRGYPLNPARGATPVVLVRSVGENWALQLSWSGGHRPNSCYYV